jgi:hypothetical protein
LPSPGTYDKHLTEFGKDAKSFTIGEKYSEKYDQNLGPGTYNHEKSDAIIKPKSLFPIVNPIRVQNKLLFSA